MAHRQAPMAGVSWPIVGEAGRTGSWRSQRPLLDASRCSARGDSSTQCQLCWLYCPEACITEGRPPIVDFRYCKGCGICAHECPRQAIRMVGEDGT